MQDGFSLDALIDALAERVAEKVVARLARDASDKLAGTRPQMVSGQRCQPSVGMFTEREAAERLGVSRQLLRKWRRDGTGPQFVKLNKCVRYPIEEIERFVRVRRSISISRPKSGVAPEVVQ
jgi:predicted DNA-binding transcriptional regulator AlpA